VRHGDGVANQRIGPDTKLHVVDAILSGTREPGTSHYQLLHAFADDATLQTADRALEEHGYLTHEFGDSVLIERRNADLCESFRRAGNYIPPATQFCKSSCMAR
jgi:S-adenosylmethionine:tRNA ribosyltransferase-isomerase